MTHPFTAAKSDCCPSDCRNGQVWNPGSGSYPCPICQGSTAASRAAR